MPGSLGEMGINTKAVPGIQELLFDVYGGFMLQVLEKINGIVWGVPALLLSVGVGLYLSVQTGFLQLRMFPEACRLFIKNLRTKNTDENGVSPYRALCTALAATVIVTVRRTPSFVCFGGVPDDLRVRAY